MNTMACIHTSPPVVYDGWDFSHYGELGARLAQDADRPGRAVLARRGYLIYGPTGSGKSCLISCFHRHLIQQKKLARWVECAAIPGNPIEAEDLLEELTFENSYVVIWDDLGKEPAHHRSRIAKIFQARALMPRRLDIITTNLNIDPDHPHVCELEEEYGAHIRSRLFGMCGENVVEMNDQDHRVAR